MIQALADGILTGAIIALGAIGVTFTLGIMRFANFAHSELLTWGAYIALGVVAVAGPGTPTGPLSFGWPLLAAALIAAVLTGLAAWAVDTLVFRRLRRRGALPLTMVFAAFGAALVMRHLIVLVWGHESHYYTRELQMAVELLPGVRMLPDQIFIVGLQCSGTTLTEQILAGHSHVFGAGELSLAREKRPAAGDGEGAGSTALLAPAGPVRSGDGPG